MVTKAQALTAYNSLNNTNYATVAELGIALVTSALRSAWVQWNLQQVQSNAMADPIT